MELQALEHFLVVAREGNITRAAGLLHITQPTLSRQLMDLEAELGVQLFVRGKRQIVLTDGGFLFQQRARELVSLLDKTRQDLVEQPGRVGGVISLGLVETSASGWMADFIRRFSQRHPGVQYNLHTADGDGLRDKLDGGDLDITLLLEPVEVAKYDSIRLPVREQWGVLMRRDDPLSEKTGLTGEDVRRLPVILPKRAIVQETILGWLGLASDELHVVAFHNLVANTVALVEKGLGVAICARGAYEMRPRADLHFVPLAPLREVGHVLAWKKNRLFNTATSLFVEEMRREGAV